MFDREQRGKKMVRSAERIVLKNLGECKARGRVVKIDRTLFRPLSLLI